MKYQVFAACILVIAGVMIAGCTQGTMTGQTSTPAGIPAATTAVTAMPHATFALGDHYLQKSYSLQSANDVRTEQFRVDNPAWGIDFVVLPLNDDPQYCWFEMTVTNMDTGQKETYGFGRTYSYDTHQQYPMYVTGPYKIEMKGNLVKVDVTAAKRNP
jgi:hypothetical protein